MDQKTAITEDIRKYLELNENEIIIYWNVWDDLKVNL